MTSSEPWDQCYRCGLVFSEASPIECPNCGQKLVEFGESPGGRSDRPFAFLTHYFQDVVQILTRPGIFFRRMPLSGGPAAPLAFALATHWLGEAVAFLWNLVIGGTASRFANQLFRVMGDAAEVDSGGRSEFLLEAQDRIQHWFWGTGPVLIDPFLTLASLLFTSVLVFAGARILVEPGKSGAPREITYESCLRILCYGMTPAILGVIPVVGGFAAALLTLVITVIGAREVYRISTGRAAAVVLFPKLLLVGAMFFGFAVFFVAIFKWIASAL